MESCVDVDIKGNGLQWLGKSYLSGAFGTGYEGKGGK